MNNKFAPRALGGPDSRLVVGLAAPWLTWYGRLVPAMVGLSHVDLRGVLAEQCPQALPAARVIGDLCLDRLAVSRSHRRHYRESLEIGGNQRLVAVSSTWGPHSMFATSFALLGDLVSELPPEDYVVVAGFHPALWFGHGPRQVLAWLREQRRRGLRLINPQGWRALVAAADVVIGDHGSATVYAAAAGVPVLLTPAAPDSVRAGSAAGQLAATAPALRRGQPLARQISDAVTAARVGGLASIASRITSEPGRAASLVRMHMYRLLRLPEPSTPAETAPIHTARVIAG
jgi:hypothetical protein